MNDITYDCWTALSAVALQTKTIRLVSCVTPLTFHWPSVTAKRVASVDDISGGRVILGVGAGYYEKEFDGYGIPFDPFNIRVQKMEEAVGLIKKLWESNGPVTHKGKYYTLKDAVLLPKPHQRPHPPIWFGGASNRIVESVAKYGNGWVPPAAWISPEGFKKKCELLSKLAAKAGRDPPAITKALAFKTIIARNWQEIREQIKKSHSSPEMQKTMVIGTPRECRLKLQEYARSGVEHFGVGICSAETIVESLRLYMEEVAPNV